MENDYGKLAYLKVVELEKKLEKYLAESKLQAVKTLSFNLSTPESKATFNRILKFNSLRDGVVDVKVSLKSPNGINLYYYVSHNGNQIKQGKTESEITEMEFSLDAYKGENLVEFSIMAGIPFTLDGLKVTASGTLDYVEGKRKLSKVTVDDVTYLIYLENGEYTFYTYQDGALKENYISSAIDAGVLGYLDGEVYIVSIKNDNGLKITYYNPQTGSGMTSNSFVSGVSSVCGYPTDNGFTVIFVKTGEVYIGFYSKSQGFTFHPTYRRGSEVFADADAPNAYIISDGFKPTKFIV